MMVIKGDYLQWFSSFLIKKSSGSGVDTSLANKSATELNYQLTNQSHRQIIRKFNIIKVYSSFRDDIWGVDLAGMQSLRKYNTGIKYLLCEIDLFNKYAWVVPLKDKWGITIVNAFGKIISKDHKPNKIWADQGREFYNKLFKIFLKINNIEMYSAYRMKENQFLRKGLLERWKTTFLSTWHLFQKMFLFHVLDDIVNKHNNTVHRTIIMKSIDVTSGSYAEYVEDSNEKDPKFKVGDHVRTWKCKNIFLKGILKIGQKKFVSLSKLRIQSRGHTWLVI